MLNTTKNDKPVVIREVSNQIFGTIRAIGDCENPELCLKDLCKSLGLDSRQVRKRLPDWVVTIHPIPDSLGRLRPTNFVTEPGIYKVIFESRRPEAEKFTSWVTSVVLPSIRKTGHYGVAPANPTPASLEDFKQSLVVSMQELVIKTVAETLKTYMPVPTMPETIKKPKAPREYYLYEVANELGTCSETLKKLLKSIHLLTEKRGYLFGETGYFGQFTPCMWNHPEFVIVNENGRREILSAYQTFKKQNPKLK